MKKSKEANWPLPTKAALWLFGGPTSTKKKLCGNFLTPLFMLKSIKISLPLRLSLKGGTGNRGMGMGNGERGTGNL